MTALESATSPAASGAAAEDVVISVRGLTKVFKDCSHRMVNLSAKVEAKCASGARPSGRGGVRQRWNVKISSSLPTVQRRKRRAPHALLGGFQTNASEINPS